MRITKAITALTPTRPLTRNADGEIITLRRVQEIPAARLADEARCEADGFITVYPPRDAIFTGLE